MKNKWITFCLLIGILTASALLSSVPIYVNGVMNRMFIKDLQNYQENHKTYPGTLYFTAKKSDRGVSLKPRETFEAIDNFAEDLPLKIKLPIIMQSKYIVVKPLEILKENGEQKGMLTTLGAYTGLEDNVKIIKGTMMASQKDGDAYEAIISETALNNLNLMVGDTIPVKLYSSTDNTVYKVKIAGVFDFDETKSIFWYKRPTENDINLYINFDVMEKDFFVQKPHLVSSMEWYIAYDYNKVEARHIDRILSIDKTIKQFLNTYDIGNNDYLFPAKDSIKQYEEKQEFINRMMMLINVPIIFMLGLFILMVSKIKVDMEMNEISVLESRGASRLRITLIYISEGLMIGSPAILAGPYIGMALSRILGASNGFFEFVARKSLPVRLLPEAFIYSAVGVVFSIIILGSAAYKAAGISIVQQKQSHTKKTKKPLWQKSYLDIILMAISLYGIYIFTKRQTDLTQTGLEASELGVDPLLFVVPALFIIGAALLLIRIYPAVVYLVFRIGKRIWKPSAYTILLQISRSIMQYNFIILFLTFTIALGLFNASSARAINRNLEERIKYAVGADMVITPEWRSSEEKIYVRDPFAMDGLKSINTSNGGSFIEPPFDQYLTLPGVESATRVYVTDNCKAIRGPNSQMATLMAITTEEFGEVAWLRSDLLHSRHWFDYLNVIAGEPSAVLISRQLANELDVKPGDTISAQWDRSGSSDMVVFAIIDYWPSWNPIKKNGTRSNLYGIDMNYQAAGSRFIVGNFAYIYSNITIEPYSILLDLKDDAEINDIYNAISERRMEVESVVSTKEITIRMKNDSVQMGINGILTLGFIIILFVLSLGFLLFWIILVRSRTLQFGIFRAIGFSFRQLISMMVLEQILTSGIAAFIGFTLGKLTSQLFVPFFQMFSSVQNQVPPFRVINSTQDQLRIFMIVVSIVIICLVIISFLVSKIKISQALKLGED